MSKHKCFYESPDCDKSRMYVRDLWGHNYYLCEYHVDEYMTLSDRELTCEACGNPIAGRIYQDDEKGLFCSRACAIKTWEFKEAGE